MRGHRVPVRVPNFVGRRSWIVLATAALLLGDGAGQAKRLPVNEYGAPVLREDGQPIVYTREQLRAQALAAPLANDVASEGRGGSAPAAAGESADWMFVALGSGVGFAGLEIATNGSAPEVVIGCGSLGSGPNQYWCILAYHSATHTYQQVFVSPLYPQGQELRRLVVADLVPGGPNEILVSRSDGSIEVWDQATRRLLNTFSSGLVTIDGMCVADVDADQLPDIIVCSNAGLAVLAADGTPLFSTTSVAGNDVVAGQMDTDVGTEIATTSGRVFDCATRSVEWNRGSAFGFSLEAADIDGDGMMEVIAAEQSGSVWAYDVDQQLPKWSIPRNSVGTAAIRVGNVDADPILELLIGDAQWGDVRVFDTRTQQLEWSLRNPEHGVTNLGFGDVDGDGTVEVLWGAGRTSSSQDNLFIANSSAIEWQSVHLDGPFHGPLLGDIDGDGAEEIVALSSASAAGSEGARLLVFEPSSLLLRRVSMPLTNSYNPATRLLLVDVDTDAALEVAVVAQWIEIFDCSTTGSLTSIWKLPASYSPTRFYYDCEIGDINGDSVLDVLVGATNYMHVHEYRTKFERFRSSLMGPQVMDVCVVNTDQDSNPEMIGLSTQGLIHVYDGLTLRSETVLQGQVAMTCMQPWSIGGSLSAMLAGDQNGRLTVFAHTGADYLSIGPIPCVHTPIDGLTLLDPKPWLAVGSGGVLSIHDGVARVWSTLPYGEGFGKNVLIQAQERRIMSAGYYGLAAFVIQ